jgi:hypothetical protein
MVVYPGAIGANPFVVLGVLLLARWFAYQRTTRA